MYNIMKTIIFKVVNFQLRATKKKKFSQNEKKVEITFFIFTFLSRDNSKLSSSPYLFAHVTWSEESSYFSRKLFLKIWLLIGPNDLAVDVPEKKKKLFDS